MKTKTAFSLDCGIEVNAEDAYDFFWAGIIKDKRNFICISEDCYAQITCANLDKLREDMSVAPYFKVYGEHSPLCPIKEAESQPYLRKDSNETSYSRAKISEEHPDIFELERPEEHRKIKEKSRQSDNILDIEEIKKRKKSRNTNDAIRSRKYHSIRGLIKKYHEYKQNNTLDSHFIKIPPRQGRGYTRVSYSEMFVEINGQALLELPEDNKRIYFGTANLYDNGTHYNIKFTKGFVWNGKITKPSIYISRTMVSEAFSRELAEKKLQSLSGKTIYCFVYSRPLPAKNEYINLNINNMDLLDIKKEFIAPILRSNRDRSSSSYTS